MQFRKVLQFSYSLLTDQSCNGDGMRSWTSRAETKLNYEFKVVLRKLFFFFSFFFFFNCQFSLLLLLELLLLLVLLLLDRGKQLLTVAGK